MSTLPTPYGHRAESTATSRRKASSSSPAGGWLPFGAGIVPRSASAPAASLMAPGAYSRRSRRWSRKARPTPPATPHTSPNARSSSRGSPEGVVGRSARDTTAVPLVRSPFAPAIAVLLSSSAL